MHKELMASYILQARQFQQLTQPLTTLPVPVSSPFMIPTQSPVLLGDPFVGGTPGKVASGGTNTLTPSSVSTTSWVTAVNPADLTTQPVIKSSSSSGSDELKVGSLLSYLLDLWQEIGAYEAVCDIIKQITLLFQWKEGDPYGVE